MHQSLDNVRDLDGKIIGSSETLVSDVYVGCLYIGCNTLKVYMG
jgi:hypothetical protein